MDSIIDYVKWLGEFPITTKKFNEVDAIVLSALCYVDFTDGLAGRESMRLSEYEGDPYEAKICLTAYIQENRELLDAAIHSERFGTMEITHYEQLYRPEVPIQFAAVTYKLKDFTFVAYRGTDSTLTGWREDFMLTFTRSNAQEEARRYLNMILEETEGNAQSAASENVAQNTGIETGAATVKSTRKKSAKAPAFYIGGHSKGGNHAIYSACMLPDEQLSRITRIYCLDGPGFCDEVLDPGLLTRIDAISVRIMPKFCIVGKLFEPKLTDAWPYPFSHRCTYHHQFRFRCRPALHVFLGHPVRQAGRSPQLRAQLREDEHIHRHVD